MTLLPLQLGGWLGKPMPKNPGKLRYFQLSHDACTLRWGWNKCVVWASCPGAVGMETGRFVLVPIRGRGWKRVMDSFARNPEEVQMRPCAATLHDDGDGTACSHRPFAQPDAFNGKLPPPQLPLSPNPSSLCRFVRLYYLQTMTTDIDKQTLTLIFVADAPLTLQFPGTC